MRWPSCKPTTTCREPALWTRPPGGQPGSPGSESISAPHGTAPSSNVGDRAVGWLPAAQPVPRSVGDARPGDLLGGLADLVPGPFLLLQVLTQQGGNVVGAAGLGVGDQRLVDGDLVVLGLPRTARITASTTLSSVLLIVDLPSFVGVFAAALSSPRSSPSSPAWPSKPWPRN